MVAGLGVLWCEMLCSGRGSGCGTYCRETRQRVQAGLCYDWERQADSVADSELVGGSDMGLVYQERQVHGRCRSGATNI